MKKTKILNKLLSFTLAAAMSASMAATPAMAASSYDDANILIDGNLNNWRSSGWSEVYNKTDKDAYVVSDENGTGIVVKAGKANSWWFGGKSIVPYSNHTPTSFDGKTLLTEFDITVPNDEDLVGQNFFNVRFCRQNPTETEKGSSTNISVGTRINNGKYELYVADYYRGMVEKFATVASTDSLSALAGTHHVKFAVDTSKMKIAAYGEDGTVSYIDGIDSTGIYHDLRFYPDTQVDDVFMGFDNSTGTTDKTVYFNNLSMKTLERGLTAAFAANGNDITATFSENVSQSALDNAKYTITKDGQEVSGASVKATKTGNKTAKLSVSGLESATAYKLAVDGIFADSARTSDGALEYTFTSAKTYNDANVLIDSNPQNWANTYWQKVYNQTDKDAYVVSDSNGIGVVVKAGKSNTWWNGGQTIVPYSKHAVTPFDGKTLLTEFDITIPNDEALVGQNFFNIQFSRKKPQDDALGSQTHIKVGTRINNGKYELYVADDQYTMVKKYAAVATADSIAALSGTHHIKFAVDTSKMRIAVYTEDGTVRYIDGIDNASIAGDLRFYSDTQIYAAYMCFDNKQGTTDKTIYFKNLSMKTLERGLTSEFAINGNDITAEFSENVSQSALDNAKYTVTKDGQEVSGASVKATKTGDKTAKLSVSGLDSAKAYKLSADNIFADSARSSDGALEYTFTSAKVYNDEKIMISDSLNNWRNSGWGEVYNKNENDAYVVSDENGIGITVKAGKSNNTWNSGKVIIPYLGQNTKAFDGKTLLTEFDITIPNDEELAGQNFFKIHFSRKKPETNAGGAQAHIKVGTRKNNGKYELYVVDDEYNMVGKYAAVATADSIAALSGTHHIKFALDTSKMRIAVYTEDGTVNYIDGIDNADINHDLRFYADTQVNAVYMGFDNTKGTTDKTVYFNNLTMKTLERGLTAKVSTAAKSTEFSTSVEFDAPVNAETIERCVTVAKKDGTKSVIAPSVSVKAESDTKAVITVSKLLTNTEYTLKLDGLFNKDGRTSNGALTDITVKTTKSDTVYVSGEPVITADESGLSATVIYTNCSDTKQNFWTAVALYSNDGKAVVIVPMNVTLEAGESTEKIFTSDKDCSGAVKAKVLVWDSIDTMNPLQKHEQINLK